MIPLNKILPELLLPLFLTLVLVGLGLWRRRRALVWAGAALLLVSAHPATGWLAMRTAEDWAVRRAPGDMLPADAVVVLSHGRSVAPGPTGVVEWHDPDRFYGGVEVFQAGLAPRLVFTAASIVRAGSLSEGDLLAAHAQALGVPKAAIRVTGPVGTTDDEAREVVQVLRAESGGVTSPHVILVTTAWHMPRARRLFEARGMVVEPYPVDFQVPERLQWSWTTVLPRPSALLQTHTSLREMYGRGYYALRAWWHD